MSALSRLQGDFLESLFGPGALEPRLELYRRNVAASLEGALAAAYPVVRRLVGEAFFREAAWRYARAFPSASGDLHLFGAQFARFIAADPFAQSLAYLPDVARLEWACHESYHAADGAPFDFAALAAVPAQRHGELRFVLDAAVRLVESSHAIGAIWEANQPQRDGTPDRRTGADRLVVHREDGVVRVRPADADEWNFLSRLAAGATLASASARLRDEGLLGAMLARFVAMGIVAGFAPLDEA